MNLYQDFETNEKKPIHKWLHYFPIYEKHFAQWCNKTITFWEIGVSNGGSLQMWSRFFGPLATVVGIDIDPNCAQHEGTNIHVSIGDQSDTNFLQNVIDKFGAPDVILDDGSHRMDHLKKTFEFMYPKISKNGVYMVEDLHTAYWEEFGGGVDKPDSFINLSKRMIDSLNAAHSRGVVPEDFITHHTFGMSFYDSIVVFERGTVPIKTAKITPDSSAGSCTR